MDRKIYQLRITLKNTKPPIWRRVAVWSDTTLGELHVVIQIVMGWWDEHLHHFIQRIKPRQVPEDELRQAVLRGDLAFLDRLTGSMGGRRYFVPRTDPMGGELDMDGADEDAVTLAEVCPKVKSKIEYEYDFGDGWVHTIAVQRILEPKEGVKYPLCQAGKLACPREDCGGVWGYYEKLAILEDPSNEMHEEVAEWMGKEFNPEAFDREAANKALTKWWEQE